MSSICTLCFSLIIRRDQRIQCGLYIYPNDSYESNLSPLSLYRSCVIVHSSIHTVPTSGTRNTNQSAWNIRLNFTMKIIPPRLSQYFHHHLEKSPQEITSLHLQRLSWQFINGWNFYRSCLINSGDLVWVWSGFTGAGGGRHLLQLLVHLYRIGYWILGKICFSSLRQCTLIFTEGSHWFYSCYGGLSAFGLWVSGHSLPVWSSTGLFKWERTCSWGRGRWVVSSFDFLSSASADDVWQRGKF